MEETPDQVARDIGTWIEGTEAMSEQEASGQEAALEEAG